MALPSSGPLTFADIQTEFGGSNPIGLNEYYAGGGLVPAGTTGTYGAVPSSGQIGVQNFYGTTAVVPAYIEEVFSTFLYNGNGSSQTITNNVNLATNGGMIWAKSRAVSAADGRNFIADTARGIGYAIKTSSTAGQDGPYSGSQWFSNLTSTGFSIGSFARINANGEQFVSRAFQVKPKFFSMVTWTGNGASGRSITHSLGAQAQWIIIKRTDTTANWVVTAHTGSGAGEYYLNLNLSDAGTQGTTGPAANGYALIGGGSDETFFNIFSGASGNSAVNASGGTYIAYLFASNAGGFGATGTDNVISCGSYVGNGSTDGPEVTLGYEIQWLMIKRAAADGNWIMVDINRGLTTYTDNELYANLDLGEGTGLDWAEPTVTGFKIRNSTASVNASGNRYLYMAIRRGPMKVPTVGTSIFYPSTAAVGTQIPTGFNPDLWIGGASSGDAGGTCQITVDRMRGPYYFGTTNTNSQSGTNNSFIESVGNTFTNITQGGATRSEWLFGRAPGFFEIVQYTGVNQFAGEYGFASRSVTHGLTVAPELMIIKSMDSAVSWYTYVASLGNSSDLFINSSDAKRTGVVGFNAFTPTSTTFQVNAAAGLNTTGQRYITYLFATVAGVSKVGSYTGTGSLQTVNCGFTTGVRYIIIKRTDSTGDWYVYNSANGISSGNDPYMLLNSSAALVTGTNYVDTTSVGFQVTSGGHALNVSGGNYIFLAIA